MIRDFLTSRYPSNTKWIARAAVSAALSYGLALAAVAAAFGLARTFLHFHLPQTFIAFALSAIAITFWYGGTKPGILAAVLAAIVRIHVRLMFNKEASQRELVDIAELIQEMVGLVRNEANRYSISIRTQLASDLPRVMADRVQLQQVFMNLILNSIEAMKDMKPSGELTIKSQLAENGQVMVSVSDTGLGLPPQQADQIFNAFFTTKPHGTGLGLSISRSIIESHDGRLWAAGNAPRGAIFHLTLPTKLS